MALRLTAAMVLVLLGLPGHVLAQRAPAASDTPIYVDGWDYDHAKTGWNIYAVLLSGDTKLIVGTEANEMFPFLSKGEKAVAFLIERKGSEIRQVMKQAQDTGAPADLGVGIGTGSICDMSPDGKQLVCPDDAGKTRQLFIFDVATKQKRQITHSARNNCLDPSWSPDGRSIAYFTGPDDDNVGGEAKPRGDHLVIYDVESAASRLLTKVPKGADQTPRWSPDGKWVAFLRVEHLDHPA